MDPDMEMRMNQPKTAIIGVANQRIVLADSRMKMYSPIQMAAQPAMAMAALRAGATASTTPATSTASAVCE
jgi:hypothetical protein